jgi:hypothetical protein
MARGLVTLLIAWWALLPPGLCACRLQAMLAPPVEDDCEHHHSEPRGHDDHEDKDCACPERATDALLSAGPELEAASHLIASLPPAQSPSPAVIASTLESRTVWRPSDSPLYLILRALRI